MVRGSCGKIIWLRDAERRPDQCGKQIIWGLLPDDNRHWSQGTILDPDNGKSYSLSAVLEPNGTLKARIFSGMPLFGKTEILRRVDLHYCLPVSACRAEPGSAYALRLKQYNFGEEVRRDIPLPTVVGDNAIWTVASRIVSSRTAPRDRGVLRCVHE